MMIIVDTSKRKNALEHISKQNKWLHDARPGLGIKSVDQPVNYILILYLRENRAAC